MMKRYCRKCGQEMELQRFGVIEFDSVSGNPIYRAGYVCQNRSGTFSGHSKINGRLYTIGSGINKFEHFEPNWNDRNR